MDAFGRFAKTSVCRKCLKRMAGTTGLEPAASAVTGQRSNQLNYVPNAQNSGLGGKPLWMRGLRISHTVPSLHLVPEIAGSSGVTACKPPINFALLS
jgi:hypothetical protein